MNKKSMIVLFVLLAIIQLAVPAVMIAKRELTLRTGEEFKFATEPVDPYDAFRGRYVYLNFKEDYAPLTDNIELKRGDKAYAHLKKNSQGFAVIYKVSTKQPVNIDYLKVKIKYLDRNRKRVYLDLPFDRYYLEEGVAKLAEKYYREVNQNQEMASYVTVRIKDGFGVLEQLYLEGEPILDYIRNKLKE